MGKFSVVFVSVVMAASGLLGCSGADDADGELQLSEDELASDSNSGFYRVTSEDWLECSFPYCGGVFVSRVNAQGTRCMDGSTWDSCYVATLDFSALGVGGVQAEELRAAAQRGEVLLRAKRIDRERIENVVAPVLRVTEAWVRQGAGRDEAEPEGTFYRARLNGVRCAQAPCPSIDFAKLNGRRLVKGSGIDFAQSFPLPSEHELARAGEAISTPEGVLIVGEASPLGQAAVDAFYLPFVAKIVDPPPPAEPCFVGGCGGQVCSARDGIITSCEWREVYACYRGETCERQPDGACGWTPTEALTQCLEAAR